MFNYTLKTIFVHIPKNAGNSITYSLKKHDRNSDKNHFPMHEEARFIKDQFSNYGSFFSFAFVRNPWDRMLSRYAFLVQYKLANTEDGEVLKQKGFNQWIMDQDDYIIVGGRKVPFFKPQYDWISDEKGDVIVNFVGRFESLAAHLSFVSDKLTCPHLFRDLPLRHKTNHKYYRQEYSDEAKKIVETVFEKDIDNFGYTF